MIFHSSNAAQAAQIWAALKCFDYGTQLKNLLKHFTKTRKYKTWCAVVNSKKLPKSGQSIGDFFKIDISGMLFLKFIKTQNQQSVAIYGTFSLF